MGIRFLGLFSVEVACTCTGIKATVSSSVFTKIHCSHDEDHQRTVIILPLIQCSSRMSSKYDDDDHSETRKTMEQEKWRRSSHEGKESSDELSRDRVIDDDELISKVQEYFYADDSLSKTFEAFVKEKASIIDLESSEYKLVYTQVYDEFRSILEEKIEKYIEDELGSSVQHFYQALKLKTDEDENSNEAVFGQILLAVCDFDSFMTMMREEASTISRK